MKTSSGIAINEDHGVVQVIHYASQNLAQPVAEHVCASHHGESACVLTNTNDEALQVVSLLRQKGLKAKLIQSNDGFRLYHLAEIRFFLKAIDRKLSSPVISDSLWNEAKAQLAAIYHDSLCLPVCLKLISDFESINHVKYRTDLQEFISESQYEDFYGDIGEAILVSTIHKSKGREFDTVYMLMNHISADTDESKRKIYVGLTRAKKELYILCNTNLFENFSVPGITFRQDTQEYSEPESLILPLTHRDVVLNFFKGKKDSIFRLHSGAKLHLDHDFLSAELNGRTVYVAKLSKSCVAKLAEIEKSGYIPTQAKVRFVVAWKGEDDEEETAVMLPDILLEKQCNRNI